MSLTSITLTDEQLDRLADALADRVAPRLVDRLTPATAPPRLVDAGELAGILGVNRETIYRRAAELGAVRLGDGSKPRLRFDVERARAAIDRSGGERSDGASAKGDGGSAALAARSPRHSAAGLPKPGSQLPLRAAPRGRRRSGEQR